MWSNSIIQILNTQYNGQISKMTWYSKVDNISYINHTVIRFLGITDSSDVFGRVVNIKIKTKSRKR